MMQRSESRWHLYYAGVIILACLTIGGGTEASLWSDKLLQLFMLPALVMGMGGYFGSRLGPDTGWLLIGVAVIFAFQFFPVSRPLPGTVELSISVNSPVLSRNIGGTLEALVYFVSMVGFFLYVARFSDNGQERLLGFLLTGVMANIVVGLIQLSYTSNVELTGLLPYTIRAGVFANENHFSTLAFCSIPFVAFFALIKNRSLPVYIVFMVIVLLAMFALGSRAGMVISLVMGVYCWVWFALWRQTSRGRLGLLGLMILALVFLLGLPLYPGLLGDDLRAAFFENAPGLVGGYLPFGSGFGTFQNLYGAYVVDQPLSVGVVNHFHNDFLELLMEGGLGVVFALGGFLFILLRRLFRSFLANAAGLSVMTILIHSTVDYPLRTMAIAIIFAYASAIVFSRRASASQRAASSPPEKVMPVQYRPIAGSALHRAGADR